MKDKITFDEYSSIANKLEIKLGFIFKVEDIPKKDKLKKLEVCFKEETGNRTVVCNVIDTFPEGFMLAGSVMPFVTNLEPVKIAGIESTAMIIPLQFGNTYNSIDTSLESNLNLEGSELKL